MDYNVEYAEKTIKAVVGEKINFSYTLDLNDADWDELATKQIDLVLYYDTSSVAAKSWSSAGSSPAITISAPALNVTDATPFTSEGIYKGWFWNTTDNHSICHVIMLLVSNKT